MSRALIVLLLGGCAVSPGAGANDSGAGSPDLGTVDFSTTAGDLLTASDLASGSTDLAAGSTDFAAGSTDFAAGSADFAAGAADLATGAPDLSTEKTDLGTGAGDLSSGSPDLSSGGVITGGPCVSGAAGATAIRVRWVNAGGTAQVQYEAFGLPDRSREKVAAYGYQIGFTPQFSDQFLGPGGLVLDSSDFVDVEVSTQGVPSISSATLAIYGRSFDTTTSGSFNWQSFSGSGATPTDFVSNVAPYQWYGATLEAAFPAGDNNILLRVKAGPSSGVLVVNRLEICVGSP